MNNKKTVYILIEFPNLYNDLNIDDIMPFIVGVFSKKSIARAEKKELSLKNKGKYLYFIEPYEINAVYLKSEEEAEEELSEALEEMVKQGIVDYRIGEDGQFYFEVVEKKDNNGKSL